MLCFLVWNKFVPEKIKIDNCWFKLSLIHNPEYTNRYTTQYLREKP